MRSIPALLTLAIPASAGLSTGGALTAAACPGPGRAKLIRAVLIRVVLIRVVLIRVVLIRAGLTRVTLFRVALIWAAIAKGGSRCAS